MLPPLSEKKRIRLAQVSCVVLLSEASRVSSRSDKDVDHLKLQKKGGNTRFRKVQGLGLGLGAFPLHRSESRVH